MAFSAPDLTTDVAGASNTAEEDAANNICLTRLNQSPVSDSGIATSSPSSPLFDHNLSLHDNIRYTQSALATRPGPSDSPTLNFNDLNLSSPAKRGNGSAVESPQPPKMICRSRSVGDLFSKRTFSERLSASCSRQASASNSPTRFHSTPCSSPLPTPTHPVSCTYPIRNQRRPSGTLRRPSPTPASAQRTSSPLHIVMDEQNVLPTVRVEHNQVTGDTVIDTVWGDGRRKFRDYIIIDARYPYEYDGGHLIGAVNFYLPDMAAEYLLARGDLSQTLILVHCEFSKERGPALYHYLKRVEAKACKNGGQGSLFPHLYVLHQGYKQFHAEHPTYCSPRGYVPMTTAAHKSECQACEKKRQQVADSTIRRTRKRDSAISINEGEVCHFRF
ncbi:uncharacterized protein MONBRDRAFT_31992 [Monosiga brevicollis MX1]|uniref:protein-tyrosine-phosphatase n=1 Tax=Monosiga brevicollis TaxID=81824 RepID=A9UWQ7_MONBE|nr:uncharacterized protein MONBRDRAFT_31992 [Monosiga brevicollis MX1]EDQ90256.1 predicted protein [Monosiga brevicollis MX1]|eukprot:XP_001745023.1 hypothetical protein [Monosiga brevicollis MX1]